eukprot:scaffold4441_cov66-Phaeocystis_antarctica.AAC.10
MRHVFCPPAPYAGACTPPASDPQTTVVARCGSEARRPPSAVRTEATWLAPLVASCLRWPSRSCGSCSLGRPGRRGDLICLVDGRLSESLSPRSPASSLLAPPLRESFCHSLSACTLCVRALEGGLPLPTSHLLLTTHLLVDPGGRLLEGGLAQQGVDGTGHPPGLDPPSQCGVARVVYAALLRAGRLHVPVAYRVVQVTLAATVQRGGLGCPRLTVRVGLTSGVRLGLRVRLRSAVPAAQD